jgi:hypothetical protein
MIDPALLTNIIKHTETYHHQLLTAHARRMAKLVPWDEEAPEDGAGAGDGSADQTVSFWERTCGQWDQRKEAHAEQPGGEKEEGPRGVSIGVAHG